MGLETISLLILLLVSEICNNKFRDDRIKGKKKKTTFQKKAKRNVQRKFPEEEVAFKPG